MVRLKADPELRGRVESLGQKPSGLGGNAALAANDLVDPLDRDSKVLGECNLGESQRLKKLLLEDLSWMAWDTVFG